MYKRKRRGDRKKRNIEKKERKIEKRKERIKGQKCEKWKENIKMNTKRIDKINPLRNG